MASAHQYRDPPRTTRGARLTRGAVVWLGTLLACACAGLAGGPGKARAAECYPHCDYNHYYGPYDFSYVRPGLYAYPVCDPRGRCAPYLAYYGSGELGVRSGNIIVTFPRRTRPRP